MWVLKQTKNISCMLLVCLLLVSSVGTCSAAYQISNQELDQLDQNLTQLSSINNQLSTDLIKSKQDLVLVRTELGKYQQDLLQTQTELVQLSKESQLAKQDLLQAQSSLQAANGSLNKLEKEVKSEIRGLKLQRDVLIVSLLYMAFKK